VQKRKEAEEKTQLAFIKNKNYDAEVKEFAANVSARKKAHRYTKCNKFMN
jgi:hypothetical protein